MGIFDFLSYTIGVDAGTQNLRIIRDNELIFNEQSKISFRKDGTLLGFGNSIKGTSEDLIISPINYIIEDFHGFEYLFRKSTRKGLKILTGWSRSFIIYFCIPSNSTEIDKRAFRDSGEFSGGKEVFLIPQNICASLGLNILFEKKDFILIDFSPSKFEISVFVNSIPISQGIFKYGTQKIFRLIYSHVFQVHNIELTETDIEEIIKKTEKVSLDEEIKIKHKFIKNSELKMILTSFFNLVNEEIYQTLLRIKNPLDLDKVYSNGAFFTGGGSININLLNYIKFDKEIKRTISPNPILDNINGLKNIIEDKKTFKNLIIH